MTPPEQQRRASWSGTKRSQGVEGKLEVDAPDAQRRKCRTVDAKPVFFYNMPETFYTELLTAFDIVGVIDCCVGEGSCALACAYLGIAYKATLGKPHVAELRWLPHCCSDKDASILVAPDFAAKKRRQRYAYLGGGQFN